LDREYCTRVPRHSVRPRIRITRDDETVVLGPGKADLLEAVSRSGSIRAAARELGMSYMRAWTLIRTMNDAFRSPLVEKERGGAGQGGARLTERGERVLALYREMDARAEKAIAAVWAKMRKEM
jgi:molybdate transport system regulatory protein